MLSGTYIVKSANENQRNLLAILNLNQANILVNFTQTLNLNTVNGSQTVHQNLKPGLTFISSLETFEMIINGKGNLTVQNSINNSIFAEPIRSFQRSSGVRKKLLPPFRKKSHFRKKLIAHLLSIFVKKFIVIQMFMDLFSIFHYFFSFCQKNA